MAVVFVHGFPETSDIWGPLREILDRESIAVALPGFGTRRPDGFTATKDAYADWLGETLSRIDEPVDVVGHDVGALLTMRVASAFDVPLRSWTVDVADIFHPRFAWPERVPSLQTPAVGEEMLKTAREVDPDDPQSTASRLMGAPMSAPAGGKRSEGRLGREDSCCSCPTHPKSRRGRYRLLSGWERRRSASRASITAGWLRRPSWWHLSYSASGPRWTKRAPC